jgi:D-alanyl-D-alanine carboxypeptidase
MSKTYKVTAACLCLLLLVALAATQLAGAQTQTKAPAAEQQAKAWLAAFNSGDRATMLDYLKANNPRHAEQIDDELRFRAMTGGFQLMKTEESTPSRFTALVKEKVSDQFARLIVEVEPAPPYRIAKLDLRATATPAEFAIPRMTQPEAIAALRTDLEHDSASDRFSGAALVAKDGTVIFEQAYGMADRERKVPNTVNTQFRIGSMNKMFTAVSIMQLVQAGKIQLTDPLGKYLTDYANKDMASKVTIEQLLSHTGGTGDIFGPEFDAHRLQLKTLQDYVKLYQSRPLKFEPGSKWEYSNYGFILLGAIIEKVSGQSYYDYVREHIYSPAGMTSTGSEPEDQAVPDRSIGYSKMDSPQWKPNTDTLPYRGTSAGGGYSTVDDLARFAAALEQHKLLDAHYTELLTTGKPGTPDNSYAFGFDDHKVNGIRCFGHGGGAPGMNGQLEICPSDGYVVAVLANLDPPAAGRIADFITNRLPEK